MSGIITPDGKQRVSFVQLSIDLCEPGHPADMADPKNQDGKFSIILPAEMNNPTMIQLDAIARTMLEVLAELTRQRAMIPVHRASTPAPTTNGTNRAHRRHPGGS